MILVLAATLTFMMVNLVQVMDIPNERSSHTQPLPRSGGVAIVIAFTAGCLAIYFAADVARIDGRYFWGFLLCAILLAVVSFIDDVTQRSFVVKFFTQMLCTVVVLGADVVIGRLAVPVLGELPLGWLGYVLTFLWMVGLTNAYNFMDGLDGLVGGVAVIAGGFLCGIAYSQESYFVYLASYALIASVGGFLVFNFPPAKIFMGDVGSAFLGFTFATLAVIGANQDRSHLSFYVVPMLLFQFIFDAAFTFFRRLAGGEKVFLPHRTHLYQLLNRTGFSHKTVSLFHYAIAAIQGLGACAIVNVEPNQRMLVFVPFLTFNIIYARWTLRRAKAARLV